MDIEAPIANTFGIGNNNPPAVDLSQPTPFDQNLTFSNIWNDTYDQLPFTGAINQLQQKANNVLFETLSFFTLFFGTTGLLTQAGADQINNG